jgi:hypothetical protein
MWPVLMQHARTYLKGLSITTMKIQVSLLDTGQEC